MTTSPGTWANHASRLCECWAASRMPPPCGPRITRGTVALPPSMYRIFAAWFTIWSMVMAMKSQIWISTMGRMPATAAPTPMPTKDGSEIGVSRTRSSPKRSRNPLDTWKMPPMSPTSSPMRKTRSSRAISPCKAALRLREGLLASRAAPGLRHARVGRVDRGLHDLDGRLGALDPVGDGGVELPLDALAQLLDVELACPQFHEVPLHARHGVLLYPLKLFLLRPVLGEIGAHAVAAPAVGHRLDA